ncbi:MAG: hypothetical protein LBM28_00770, partial [Oscillospiraceae bacterium]|nr:hypothetical protein [Oscillospiraceae bacterium]
MAKARERRFGVGTYGLSLAYLSLLFVYLELLLHFFTFGSVGVRIVYAIFFSLAFAGVLSLISALLPQKGRKVVVVIVVLLLCILYETQLIYRGVFGSFMPIAQIALGKNAVENFTNQILYCIRRNILPFLLLLLPVVLTLLFAIKSKLLNFQLKLRGKLVAAAISVGTIAIALAALLLTNSGPGSAYRILTDSGTATDNCVKNVGLLATTLQEAHYQLFGDDGPILNGVVSGEIVQRDEEEFNVDPSIDFTQLPKGDADL